MWHASYPAAPGCSGYATCAASTAPCSFLTRSRRRSAWHARGAQEYFGIRADLAAYAKAMGNGFPVSAIAGRDEIMAMVEPGRVAHGGALIDGGVLVDDDPANRGSSHTVTMPP